MCEQAAASGRGHRMSTDKEARNPRYVNNFLLSLAPEGSRR